MLNTPVHLSLAADIFLREASKEAVSSGAMYALLSFLLTNPLKSTIQLDSTHQHHPFILPPWFVTKRPSQKPKLNLMVLLALKQWHDDRKKKTLVKRKSGKKKAGSN